MKPVLIVLVFIFSHMCFAKTVKLKSKVLVGGVKSFNLKLIDVVEPHKVDQGLIPIFEEINIIELNADKIINLEQQDLVKHLKKIKSDYPELGQIKFILPQRLKLIHSGYKLTTAVMAEILKRDWSKQCSSCRFIVENINIPELESSQTGMPWVLKVSKSLPRGRFNAQLIFPNQSGRKSDVWLTGQAMAQKPVAVVTRNIPKGDMVDLSSVSLAFKNIGNVDDAIVDLNVLKHRVSSKYLMTGDIIRTKYLINKVMFRRGDAVKLILQEGNLSVSTSGIAEAIGKIGNRVWVKAINKKRVSGIVLKTGEVLVQ